MSNCGYLNEIAKNHKVYAICAVGYPKVGKKIIEKPDSRIHFQVWVDHSVMVSEQVDIGESSIICVGTILTVDIKMGKYVILNLDCTIGHNTILHDYMTVYPSVNVSRNANVGECVKLGTGMQIIQEN